MQPIFIVSLVLILGGQLAWLLASNSAIKWMSNNIQGFNKPSTLSTFLIGRLFTSIKPVNEYKKHREVSQLDYHAYYAFYAGLGTSLSGFALMIVAIINL